jgi:glycosyltransferase involved in cell wall biosynthesis
VSNVAPPVHLVVAGGDKTAPSGGDVYHHRLRDELAALRRRVRFIEVPGMWPRPAPEDAAWLARVLDAAPDGDAVLLDGLVACAAPDIVVPQARRLRLVVVVHLPLAAEWGLAADTAAELDRRERHTLHAVHAAVATSEWTARHLREHHRLPARCIHLAPPGADPAPPRFTGTEGRWLTCAAVLSPRKGQDLLLRAVARLGELDWRLTLAGGPGPDRDFPKQLHALIEDFGLADRVELPGPVAHEDMPELYAATDLLVLPSRDESYGMVLTEALARGIPVLATNVGGVAEAVGRTGDGDRPGLLVSPDSAALSEALRAWLQDPHLRRRLGRAALDRRGELPGWNHTARRIAQVLEVVAGPRR